MLALEGLWKNRLATLLTNLAKGLREHEEVASLADHIGADYAGRFLVELIQNANDQAVLAQATGTSIVIVRTPELIAVTNEGRPFDERGLLAITSLGVSPKKAGITIGNKGVGFKAVFQVTESPELFSAPAGNSRATFQDEGGLWFRFDREPISEPGVRVRLETLIAETLRERPQDAEELRQRSVAAPCDAMHKAIQESASFRYPIPLDRARLTNRLTSLRLPALALSAQTLIVLPLLRKEDGTICDDTQKVVAEAFRELLSHADAIVLFLTGVARIVIDDRVSGERHVLERQSPQGVKQLCRGSQYMTVATRCETTRANGPTLQMQQWMVARRTIGAAHPGMEEQATQERAALNAAAKRLPGRNWDEVETADVTVAVKIPDVDAIGSPLGPTGLLCIGLPTKMTTGTPVWVDARFHGNLPRTEIYWVHAYNELLLREAVCLVSDLIEQWKIDLRPTVRRLPTLICESALKDPEGVLMRRFHEPDGLAGSAIVLTSDGASFVRAADLVVPAPADMEIFDLMAAALPSPHDYGFVLPDRVLLHRARSVLNALPASATEHGAPRSIYIERSLDQPSLLEAVAKHHRAADHRFWEPFLSWIVKSFTPLHLLDDQQILPVGTAGLERPSARVFLRPVPRARGAAPAGGEGAEEEIALDESVGERDDETFSNRLPADAARNLPFLDERAVRPRQADGSTLTDVGRTLAPERGDRLVRRPQAAAVINDLFGPYLQKLGTTVEEAQRGLVILRTALRWMRSMTAERRKEITPDLLRVPVSGANEDIIWIQPRRACFGAGWWDDRVDELLTELASKRSGQSLLSWSAFAQLEGLDATSISRQAWREDLRSLGVARGPHIVRVRCDQAPLRAGYDNRLHPTGVACPIPAAKDWWPSYLETIGARSVTVRSNQAYEVEEVIWLDGLEKQALRAILLELVLQDPSAYLSALFTRTQRQCARGDQAGAPALWIHAWQMDQWPLIPTDRHDLCKPSIVFQLEDDQRRLERIELLPTVAPAFRAASQILEAVGVPSLANASAERLASALHRLAERLPVSVAQEQAAAALAHDLFDRLQNRCKQYAVDLSSLVSRPVPVEQGRALVKVDLRSVPRIYVADDAVRYRLLESPAPPKLPLRSGDRFVAFVEALRGVLGEGRVVYTSEAAIETGFVPACQSEGEFVLDALAKHYPNRLIETEIALVLACMGSQRMDPNKERFRAIWGELTRTHLLRGRFGEAFQHPSFLDRTGPAPVLKVAQDLKPADMVATLYTIAGPAHRHAFIAFARALEDGPTAVDRFFHEEVSPAERDEVAGAIGLGHHAWAAPLIPFFFAFWRKRKPTEPAHRFHSAWRKVLNWEELVAFVEDAGLVGRLRETAKTNDDGQLAWLLQQHGIDGPTFFRLSQELGQVWQFRSSKQLFMQRRNELVATLRTAIGRSPCQGSDLDSAHVLLQDLLKMEAPAFIAGAPPNRAAAIKVVLDTAAKKFSSTGDVYRLLSIINPLAALEPESVEIPRDSSLPAREVNEFLKLNDQERGAEAAESLNAILRVAEAVAEKLQEALDSALVRDDGRVASRTGGPFANRYTLLYVLHDTLGRMAPRTAAALSNARAFHDATTWQALWKNLGSLLGPISEVAQAPLRPMEKVTILGLELDEAAVDADLSSGEAGLIGQRIVGACADSLDLASLRSKQHGTPPEMKKGKPSLERRNHGRSHKAARKERERIGLLGEIFVLEQFRKVLPNFDHSNWTSENRDAWAGLSGGSDRYAADFDYTDVDGQLTGLPGAPKCFIEVKSSTGDSDQAFYMTVGEWTRAEECHRSGGREVYLIVRVSHVDTAPCITDILIDPVAMKQKGLLKLAETEFWVGVGARVAAADAQHRDPQPQASSRTTPS